MPRDQQPWDDADLATAREMWDRGCTASVIAERLNRTRNSIIGLAHRRNFPPRAVETRHIWRRGKPKASPRPVKVKATSPYRIEHHNLLKKLRSKRGETLQDIPPAVAAGTNATAFLDVRPNQCRMPLWAGREPIEQKFYCGNPVVPALPWCPTCLVLVSAPPRQHRKAA